MNYSELLDNVRNYTEVTSDVLSNSVINVFITNTENQIGRLIDTDAQRRFATSTFEVNNSFLDISGPEGGFRFARGLQLHKSDGTITWLEQVDTTFIDEYSVERSTSDSNFTTFISSNAPEVLLYGVLSECFSYLKNGQDMQLYTQKFQTALTAFVNEQMGRKRRDEYADGVLRVPLPSADPKA